MTTVRLERTPTRPHLDTGPAGPRLDTAPAWLWVGVPWAIAVALYAPMLPGLAQEWAESPVLSHGFAVPFIAGYLVWARRAELRAATIAPSWWGLPPLLIGLAAMVLGVHGQEPFIARASLPATLLGVTLLVGGWSLTRVSWIAIAYLAFMIPLPWTTLKTLMYQSRLLDATISRALLDAVGVPVLQDGVFLHLPAMTLEVADACSSIPAIAALLALGIAYSTVVDRPLAAKVVLVASALPLAIASNIVRITTTALGVHYIGPVTLQTVYHQFNGTVNFFLTFFLLLLLDRVLLAWTARRR
ncbi:MAG TPA: exosortase [Candidatus Tectomicrobia bacterium]|nr:exosortase [Candidatus Tectomicrobia bacterium]